MTPELDVQVRTAVYRHFVDQGRAPGIDVVAREVGSSRGAAREACQRLHATRMLVLMPDGDSIRMAAPFSGIPTQHRVIANGKEYFANCAWDSFGVLAALHAEGDVHSRCEQTHDPLRLRISSDGPPPSRWLFHAAVPAVHWWRDIVHT